MKPGMPLGCCICWYMSRRPSCYTISSSSVSLMFLRRVAFSVASASLMTFSRLALFLEVD